MAGKEYQMAFSIGAKVQGQFGAAFKSAQASVVALQGKIESLNKQQGNIAAYQKTQQAIEKTRAKLQLYQQQYANLKAEMEKSGDASAAMKNQLLAKGKAISDNSKKLAEQESRLNTYGQSLNEAGIDTNNLAKESENLANELSSLKAEQESAAQGAEEMGQSMADSASAIAEVVAAAGLMKVFQVGVQALKECSEAAIEYESAMAAVKRTVGGSDAFLQDLGESFKDLSTEIPISAGELAGIATTAGQLGIAQENVESFTTVMAKLATTTDLSADSAATMLAQFANITGLTDYERLGSVVAELGDATATTASKVVEMSQGMAASASQAGMSSVDIMAISASLGSLGIEAQAGSTSMSTLISTLYKAVETGEGLSEFASIANMTADQFKQAWGDNAVGALNSFIQGLNDTERNGKSAIVVLDELGITNVRQTKAILGLASAGNLLSNTLAQAGNAWNQNTALAAKASVMYETTEAKLTMLGNGFNNLKIAVGEAFTPIIAGAAGALTDLLQPVTSFIQKNPALVRAFTAAAAVVGVTAVAVTGYAAAMRIAAKAQALFTATIPGLNIVLAVAAGLAAVTAGAILLAEAFKGSQESMEELDAEFDGLNADFKKQSNIRSLCAEYKQLQQELYNTSGATEKLSSMDDETVTIHVTAEVAEGFKGLSADDFVDGTIVTLTGKEDTDALLKATQFLQGGENGSWIKLDAEKGNQISSKDLINDLINNEAVIKLSGDAQATVAAAGFLKPGEDTIPLKALPETITSSAFFTNALADGTVQIGLTPDVASTLDQYRLLQGSTVELSAKAQAKMVNADEFMIGKDVELNAQAVGKLYANGFLNGSDIIYLNGDVDEKGKVTTSAFIAEDERTIEITASPEGSVSTSDYISEDDRSIQISATPADSGITADSYFKGDKSVDITGTPKGEISTGDYIPEDKRSVEIEATPKESDMSVDSFFKGDKSVEISGTPSGEITTGDYIPEDKRSVTITAQKDENSTLSVDSFFSGEKAVGIKGTPTGVITVEDYIAATNRVVELTAEVTNLEQVKEAITSLQSEADTLKTKAATAKTDLTDAQKALSDMETRQQQLQSRLTYAGTESAKSEIQSAIEAQSVAIEAQRGKVEELELAYSSASTQYALTKAAADELASKEERLSEIKSALADSSDAVKSSMAGETSAMDEQIEKADQLARAEQARLRSDIYENLGKQAKQYANAVKQTEEANSYYGRSVDTYNRTLKYAEMTAEDVTNAYNEMLSTFDQQAASDSFDPLSESAKNALADIEALHYLMTGSYEAAGEATTSDWILNHQFGDLSYDVSVYNEAVQEADANQQAFIDNLSSGVSSGALTAKEAYRLLSTSLEEAGLSTEDVAEATEQLRQALGEGATDAEGMADGMGEITASAAEVNAAMQPVLDKMAELGNAYAEAYEAAYKSMDGQFKLFEEAPKLTEESVDKMIESLQSQAAYMQEYTANLKAAGEMGLSQGLLAQLSDGSKESAAYLAAIVSEGSTKIDELNAAFAGVEDGKAEFANTVAEMETDFAAKMQQLSAELAATVATMDMSSEAASAGAATVQAFADGAKGKVSAVTAAFQAVASAAASLFNFKIGGHAAGTESAERGFAWVGERGPELMWFNGGEQVMNAQDSRNFVRQATNNAEPVQAITDRRDSNYHIEVKPEFNITGGGNTADMETIMQQQTERMREMVEEVLSDIESDHVRSVYTK